MNRCSHIYPTNPPHRCPQPQKPGSQFCLQHQPGEAHQTTMALSDPHIHLPALQVQVGGNHYKGFAIQPMEFAEANGLPPCLTRAIAYIVRHRNKNGKQDLEKASHCIDLAIALYPLTKKHIEKNPPAEWAITPEQYLDANKISGRERVAIIHLLSVFTVGVMGYTYAKVQVDELRREEYR
jgi:hypothetical protein